MGDLTKSWLRAAASISLSVANDWSNSVGEAKQVHFNQKQKKKKRGRETLLVPTAVSSVSLQTKVCCKTVKHFSLIKQQPGHEEGPCRVKSKLHKAKLPCFQPSISSGRNQGWKPKSQAKSLHLWLHDEEPQ